MPVRVLIYGTILYHLKASFWFLFFRFEHKVFGYRSPTVFIVELAENGSVFAITVDEEWKQGSSRWGKSNCAIFQMKPSFELIESKFSIEIIFFSAAPPPSFEFMF